MDEDNFYDGWVSPIAKMFGWVMPAVIVIWNGAPAMVYV